MAWKTCPTSKRHGTYPDLQAAAPESNSHFSPHVQIPLGPVSAGAEVGTKALAEGHRAGFILHLPSHWPWAERKGWLFPAAY